MKKKIKVEKRKATSKVKSKKKSKSRALKARAKQVKKVRIKKKKAPPSPQKFMGKSLKTPGLLRDKGVPAEVQRHKVEEAKYYPRPRAHMPPRKWEKEELPFRYGDNRIVVLVRDPYWLYAYWEVTDDKKSHIEEETRSRWGDLRKVLRIYDVTDVIFDGTNANKSFDIELTSDANNWYIRVGKPNRSWCVDLGVITSDGKFILIARSKIITTPLDRPSDVIDEEWMTLEKEFAKIYGISGGVGVSSPHIVPPKRRKR